MNRAELIALASPPCHQCGQPILRLEIQSARNEDGEWVVAGFTTVCEYGHRVPVEPLP